MAVTTLLFQNSSTSIAIESKKASEVATDPLVRCITPGIAFKNTVEIRKPFRVLYQTPGEPLDPGYIGKAEFVNASVEKILVGGQPVIALVATYTALEDNSRIGGQVVVLAFFRMHGRKPSLIDAVDISTDRFCGFSTEPVLHYKNGTDAVVVENSHFNSSENFCILTPVALVDGRLISLCNEVPILYNAKGARISMVEQGRLVVGVAPGLQPKPLSMSIRVICKTFDENDGDKVLSTHRKTFTIPFKLHGKTYSVNSKGKELAALNDFVKKNGFDTP
ncbi:MAG: hypothetical protein JST89_01455 [Cyanobacteria bacterium SZAS-4]|nr:hypothetical protein [Cyanobacteria bacterium SZAS-4]